jgi:hypothetical protein
MQMTLLDLTQNVLSSLDSDEVNSIGDTVESKQVAQIIKNKYYDIVNRVNLPEHEQLIQLDPSLDITMPVMMYVPDGVVEIKWLKYFNTNIINEAVTGTHDINVDIVPSTSTTQPPVPGYAYVTILPIQQFIDMTNTFNPENSDVESFTFTSSVNGFPGTYTFYYKTDKTPQFCTILSDYNVIFDSYDATQDSTLQASKTMAWGRIIPNFKMEDSFVPNLDDEQFTLLLNEAKALAYFELKQSVHPKAEQEIKRGWSSVQKNKAVSNKPTYFEQLPNFGRRGGMATSQVSYFKSRGWDSSSG